MATKTNFYLNEVLVNEPKNWQELEIELSFDRDDQKEAVSINSWEFVRENSAFINEWIEDGLGTGVGVFEGVPFRIEIERNGLIEKPFNGYIDLTDDGSFSCNRSTVKAKERQQIDWLNDVADGFTFEYLFKETKEITKDDFVMMPYIINSIPDYKEAAIALISVYMVKNEIKRVVQQIKELIPQLANPFEGSAIIRAVLLIAYVVILIISLVKLIKDIINMIIQPVKYHAGMYVKTLLEKGAAHLGMTFSCDILNIAPFNKLFIIPEKFFNPIGVDSSYPFLAGFTKPNKAAQEGFYKGTFGDLIRQMKLIFNARLVIVGNEIKLIRNGIYNTNPTYVIPDVYQPFYGINASEFISNYLVSFQTDLTDKNTIQDYQGTSFQVILQPKTIVNKDLVLMKHLEEVRIGFALAKRKEEFTVPEKIIKELLDVFSVLVNGVIVVINGVIKVYNALIKILNKIIKALKVVGIKISFQIQPINNISNVNLGKLIEDRIGMLKVEADYFSVPKIMLINEGNKDRNNKLTLDNASTVNAKYLYDNFHFANSFYPSTELPNANQYILKEVTDVPFCIDDFVKVKSSNFVTNAQGQRCLIDSIKWDIYNQKAAIKYRVNQLYTNNIRKIELYPDGK